MIFSVKSDFVRLPQRYTVAIRYKGLSLPFATFDQVGKVKQADIVSNKRLGSVLAFAREKQETEGLKRTSNAPKRRGQKQIYNESHSTINPALL